MSRSRRPRSRQEGSPRTIAVGLATVLTAGVARAQERGPAGVAEATPPSAVTLRARDTTVRRVRPGATLSAAFVVRNGGADSVRLAERVAPPSGWSLVTGRADIILGPGESDPWVVGVLVPEDAVAGRYTVPVEARLANGAALRDTLRVEVVEHRAVGVELAVAPEFALAAERYEVRFTVRNRGNAPARVRLQATAGPRAPVSLSAPALTLPPNGVREVVVEVRGARGESRSAVDLVELTAVDDADEGSRATASAPVTVVARAGGESAQLTTIPAEVRLRTGGGGVSPVEMSGGGEIAAGRQVDFLLRAPSFGDRDRYSPFQQQDEYRLSYRTARTHARLGDQLFMLSPLTSSGTPGFGAGVDSRVGRFALGGFASRARWSPESGAEAGAFVRTPVRNTGTLALNVLDRTGGQTAGRVASAGFSTRALAGSSLDVEVAASGATIGRGVVPALDARLEHGGERLAFDASVRRVPTAFAGAQQGTSADYLNATVRVRDGLQLGAAASRQDADLTARYGATFRQHFAHAGLSATLLDRFVVGVEHDARADRLGESRTIASQNVLRARASQPFGGVTLSLGGQAGLVRDAVTGEVARSHAVSASGDASLGERVRLGAFADFNDGRSVQRLGPAVAVAGLNASARLPFASTLNVSAFGMRSRGATTDSAWAMQGEVGVERRFRRGTLSLRARSMTQPEIGGVAAPRQASMYLEYSRSVALPVGPGRQHVSARGRVVDAATGRGVRRALVRVGGQAAVTDDDGRVTFRDLQPGTHPVSVGSYASLSGALAFGDRSLTVDGSGQGEATFQVNVARGARISAAVRRFTVARTSLGQAPDSLADAGGAENVAVVLAGPRDTVVATTRADGTIDFGELPPGHWVATATDEGGAGQRRFESDRFELDVTSGETRTVLFRLLPRAREVQLMAPPAGMDEIPTVPLGAPRATAPAAPAATSRSRNTSKR